MIIKILGGLMVLPMVVIFALSIAIVASSVYQLIKEWREDRRLRPDYPSIRKQAKRLDVFTEAGEEWPEIRLDK